MQLDTRSKTMLKKNNFFFRILMSIDLSPSLVSNTSGPALLDANINQQAVDLTIDALIQFLAKSLSNNEIAENIQFLAKPLSNNETVGKPQKKPEDTSASGFTKENRYFFWKTYKISDLGEDHPLNAMLIPLSKKISDLGFPCDQVEIRFEKGCFKSMASEWHRDGYLVKHSINLCYSNKENWSTRILDNKDYLVYGVFGNLTNTGLQDPSITQKIESLAQAAKFGFLFDAKKFLHRSPLISDLTDQNISINDYRLLIRFSKENK